MSESCERQARRSRVAWITLGAGILIALYAIFNTFTEIEGAIRAGGPLQYLGVSHWRYSLPFVLWGLSLPTAAALALIAAALRDTGVPGKLAVGVTAGFLAVLVGVGVLLTFPTVGSAAFGVGGTIIAIGIMITLYLSGARLRREDPWPGLLRSLGYLAFASAAWFTSGIFTTPGSVSLPGLAQDQAIIRDLAFKVLLFWASGWVLTAVGFVLERRRPLPR